MTCNCVVIIVVVVCAQMRMGESYKNAASSPPSSSSCTTGSSQATHSPKNSCSCILDMIRRGAALPVVTPLSTSQHQKHALTSLVSQMRDATKKICSHQTTSRRSRDANTCSFHNNNISKSKPSFFIAFVEIFSLTFN